MTIATHWNAQQENASMAGGGGRRGRPSRQVSERFAVMAWFAELLHRSGMEIGGLTERYLPPTNGKKPSTLMYKYQNGLAFPDHIRSRIAWEYPGIDFVFGRYFWHLLDERVYSLFEVSKDDSFMDRKIRRLVVDQKYEVGPSFIADRSRDDWLATFDALAAIGNFDALEGVVLLLRQLMVAHLHEISDNFPFRYGCRVMLDLWRAAYFHPMYGGFAENLYRWLEHLFCPLGVPMDREGRTEKSVPELARSRRECAAQERPGWTPDAVYIKTPWLEDILDPGAAYRVSVDTSWLD